MMPGVCPLTITIMRVSTVYGIWGTCWYTCLCRWITCMKKVLSEEEESILQYKPTQGSHSILYRKQSIKCSL